MKVAVLIDAWLPFLGGGQKAVLEVSRILKKEKKVDFIIFHSFNPHIFARSLWLLYVIPQVIFCHIFINRFDLIDARAYSAGFPGKIISLILGVPIIYTVGGCGNLDQKNNNLMSWVERWLLTGIKYDQQISDSRHFLKYKNVNKNIIIIPNGVDLQKFDRVKVKKNKQFTIIYVGRLAKIKGLNYLLKSIKLLKNKNISFILKIIGQGEEGQFLKDYVKKNNLERWVKFLGEVKGERLIEEFKSSHLFVLPSLAEGQPITLLEAWAAKLPVIASKVGSIPYYVNVKSNNGYLTEPANSKQLANTLTRAMRNKKLVEMGQNGYLLIKKNYIWEKSASRYWQVYKKLSKI